MSLFIGERIAALRKGKTQQQVADEIGISRALIKNWELGIREIRGEDVARLAVYFGVTSDYLLGLSPIKSPNETVQGVCSYTGLSEKAVENITALNNQESLSRLLENPLFISLLNSLESVDVAASDVITQSGDNVTFEEFVNQDQLILLRLLKFETKETFSRIVDELYPTPYSQGGLKNG